MTSPVHDKEFIYTVSDFERVCRLVYQWAGIKLSEAKQDMVYSRLARQVRAQGMKGFKEYLDFVEKASNDDRQAFMNALTTNLTSFFRENHHFDRLKQLFGDLKGRSRLTIWCAAASTGEEPYSLAMAACEYFGNLHPPVELIASDIDTNVLNTGKQGVYALDRVSKLSEARLKSFFLKGTGANEERVKIRQELQALIQFKQINLLDGNWDGIQNKKFDAIFCRNVMIYFDRPTQERLVRRFRQHLQSDGLLFVGHSESLHYATDCFKSLGNTVYQPI